MGKTFVIKVDTDNVKFKNIQEYLFQLVGVNDVDLLNVYEE